MVNASSDGDWRSCEELAADHPSVDQEFDELSISERSVYNRQPSVAANARLVLEMRSLSGMEVVHGDARKAEISDKPRKMMGDGRVNPNESQMQHQTIDLVRLWTLDKTQPFW